MSAISNKALVWSTILIVSDLPEALWHTLTGTNITGFFWIKIGVLFSLILFGQRYKQLHLLRTFFFILLIFSVGRSLIHQIGFTPDYIAGSNTPIELLTRLMQFEGSRLFITTILAIALYLMEKRKSNIFLRIGELKRWKWPGIIIALLIMVLTFLFFEFDVPSQSTLIRMLPLVPFTLSFAALAALDEEMRYRALLLPTITQAVGKSHAILVTAFLFGMSHYFEGVPSGIDGFLIAGSLGWLYAVMMVETKGIFMPWLNHFLTNIPTFLFWVMIVS